MVSWLALKKSSDKVIGYASYFSLINGFEKTFYMAIEDVNKHAGKFSQTFKKGYGLWKDDYESMATKTVLKLLLSKFAPLSVEMQKAVMIDQGVIKDDNATEVEYADHEDVTIDKEQERVRLLIEDSKSARELTEGLKGVTLTPELTDMYNEKISSLNERK